jgi:hypothetical protein
MRFRKLRIAWSVAGAVAAVLLIVLWVRSYTRVDGYIWSSTNTGNEELLMCGAGRVVMAHNFDLPEEDGFEHYTTVFKSSNDMQNWFYLSTPICDPLQRPISYPAGFGLSRISNQGFVITFPFWFASTIAAFLAAGPWFRQLSVRFSLRTLLIITTLVAVVLGLIAAALRWPAG